MLIYQGKPHYHFSTYNWKTPKQFNDVVQTIINLCWNSWWTKTNFFNFVIINKHDVWNLDSTLTPIILKSLKEFKKQNTHGAPNVEDIDVPDNLKSTQHTKENDYDTDPDWFKRWNYVIEQMIWSYQELNDDVWETQYHTGVMDRIHVPLDINHNECSEEDAKMYRWDKGPNDTSHFDAEGYKKHQEKIQNGLNLFGKYYNNLWD